MFTKCQIWNQKPHNDVKFWIKNLTTCQIWAPKFTINQVRVKVLETCQIFCQTFKTCELSNQNPHNVPGFITNCLQRERFRIKNSTTFRALKQLVYNVWVLESKASNRCTSLHRKFKKLSVLEKKIFSRRQILKEKIYNRWNFDSKALQKFRVWNAPHLISKTLLRVGPKIKILKTCQFLKRRKYNDFRFSTKHFTLCLILNQKNTTREIFNQKVAKASVCEPKYLQRARFGISNVLDFKSNCFQCVKVRFKELKCQDSNQSFSTYKNWIHNFYSV